MIIKVKKKDGTTIKKKAGTFLVEHDGAVYRFAHGLCEGTIQITKEKGVIQLPDGQMVDEGVPSRILFTCGGDRNITLLEPAYQMNWQLRRGKDKVKDGNGISKGKSRARHKPRKGTRASSKSGRVG